MRFPSRFLHSLPVAALAATFLAASAGASDLYGERVHADSFGNLVIYSPAGYKRIVVGKGYLAPEFARLNGAPEADAYYGDVPAPSYRRCVRPPAMFKGRSYMYGLPDHVVPVPGDGYCE